MLFTACQESQRIPKPRGGSGGGKPGPGDPGEGEDGNDDFTWHLSEDFVIDYILRDLGLPNLTKPVQGEIPKNKIERAGYASDGPSQNLHLVKSKLKKVARMNAVKGALNNRIIALLEEEKSILSSYNSKSGAKTEENSDKLPGRKITKQERCL